MILSDVCLHWKIDPFCFSISKNASARHGVIKVVELKKKIILVRNNKRLKYCCRHFNKIIMIKKLTEAHTFE